MEISKSPTPPPATSPTPFKLPTGDDLPKLPYAKLVEIRQNHPEDYEKLLLSCIRMGEKAKSLANFYGKLLCLEQRRYDAGKRDGLIISGYSFRDWFELNHGKFPARAYCGAKVFGTFVLAPENHPRYVLEAVYDILAGRLIEAASKVVNAAKRHGLGMDHQVFADAAAILKAHGDTAKEQMEEIEGRLVWDSKATGEYETKIPVYLTKSEAAARRAREAASDTHGQICTILKSGGLDTILAVLAIEARQTSDEETARKLTQFAAAIPEKLAENVVEIGWVKSADGKTSAPGQARRFQSTQLKEWAEEWCAKDSADMTEEDKRTEYCWALDRMKEIEKVTDRETLQQWVSEQETSTNGLKCIGGNAAGQEIAAIIPVQSATPPRPASPSPLPKIAGRTVALKRWRGAEQQVLELLRALGWHVEDVSRQNIGYDIGGRDPDGNDGYVEVKSVDNPGQPFTLTSNEEAVARDKGAAYWLALVRQTQTDLEVAFIRDPSRQLKLTRQCRQWVWECAAYEFTPERYPLE